ncbi:hypothetical protein [Nitrospirillum viridazoti]|uniref:hypothetical protein n=1 Tax=Nitrospirillum viridazoti TaxID=3144925 RepID=UPI0009DA80FD|nr:hypothetical protein [Nitrospirillum amazonense]
MTRQGSSKAVPPEYAEGRLKAARAFLKSAQTGFTLFDEGDVGNPIMSQIINAAIAYGDALTAISTGKVNQQDHAGIVRTLRAAFGNRLPDKQEANLRRIISEKDEVQYGARQKTRAEAERMLHTIEEFAKWSEDEFQESARKRS